MDPIPIWDALLKPWKADQYFVAEPRPRFRHEDSGYSPVNAWWLAELARLVYRDQGRAEFLTEAGLVELRFFEHGATQCSVIACRDPAFAVVAFRGTNGLDDWVTNLTAVRSPWPRGGGAHKGFQRALARVWDDVEALLDDVSGPVFYTGHSLGGALATLAASARPPRAVYTIGAPRVGDVPFCASMAEVPLYRIVNRRDVVPTVPPSLTGFRHPGSLRYITQDGRVLADPSDDDVAADQRTAEPPDPARPRGRLDPPPNLADHAPLCYVESLRRHLGPEHPTGSAAGGPAASP